MIFREYVVSTGLKIFGGKTAENNDELIWNAKAKDVLLHTDEPGSPFVNVGMSPSKKDLNEAAVFCAKYSQDWRNNKKDVVVHKFLRSDMKKSVKMRVGSWKVRKQEKIKVKKSNILKFEEKLKDETN